MTTNYEKHFGSPEDAAKTVTEIIDAIDGKLGDEPVSSLCDLFGSCEKCPVEHMCCSDRDMILWLESESEQ